MSFDSLQIYTLSFQEIADPDFEEMMWGMKTETGTRKSHLQKKEKDKVDIAWNAKHVT